MLEYSFLLILRIFLYIAYQSKLYKVSTAKIVITLINDKMMSDNEVI